MKYFILIPQGASDEVHPDLGGRTPLETARTPSMDALAARGRVGLAGVLPSYREPGEAAALLALLGYDGREEFSGRAALTAAGLGIDLSEKDVPFCADFVTEFAGVLVDNTGGAISTKEAAVLIKHLNRKLAKAGVRFYVGHGNHHLAVICEQSGLQGLSVSTFNPARIEGDAVDQRLPKGPGDESLAKLMREIRLLLQDHEVNLVRVDLGENPCNLVWFWGQGLPVELENFEKRFGLKGALVSGEIYARGIARGSGLEFMACSPAEDFLEQLAKKTVGAIDGKDLVVVHWAGCLSGEPVKNAARKTEVLEAFDRTVVKAVEEYCRKRVDSRVMICPGFSNSTARGMALRGSVPCLFSGARSSKRSGRMPSA